ncbi:MAG: dihydrodipicolinate synthase family protein [Paenibacillus sp.]|jgi:4-hydroxy-tetrahydrodipicolinate synthase|nr:dihydrodipicolinate synthase family protein [Paenibacillus sp.]
MHSAAKMFTGVIPPLLTPLMPDYTVDVQALSGLVDYAADGGVSALFAMGTASEAPMLTRCERARALETIAEAGARRAVPVIVGVMEASTARTLELVREAEQLHASAIVVAAPYYYKVKQEEIVRHYEAVRQATHLPIVLYNLPPHIATGNELEAETVAQIAAMPGVVAYKDSTGNMERFLRILRMTEALSRFSVFQGVHSLCMSSLQAGADGLVLGLANAVPAKAVALIEAVRGNDSDRAAELQQTLVELDRAIASVRFPLAAIKTMAQLLGYGSGIPHYPMYPLTEAEKARIGDTMRQHGLLSLTETAEEQPR